MYFCVLLFVYKAYNLTGRPPKHPLKTIKFLACFVEPPHTPQYTKGGWDPQCKAAKSPKAPQLTGRLPGHSTTGGSQNDPTISSTFRLASPKTMAPACPISTHPTPSPKSTHTFFSLAVGRSRNGTGPANDDSRMEKSRTMQHKCMNESEKPDGFLPWQHRPFLLELLIS